MRFSFFLRIRIILLEILDIIARTIIISRLRWNLLTRVLLNERELISLTLRYLSGLLLDLWLSLWLVHLGLNLFIDALLLAVKYRRHWLVLKLRSFDFL
jgi:hypothetical protein